MRIPLDNDDMEPTPPQTESSRERGFDRDIDESEFGESDGVDETEAGDIADEGSGHRG
jgi:hypothetical protein